MPTEKVIDDAELKPSVTSSEVSEYGATAQSEGLIRDQDDADD